LRLLQFQPSVPDFAQALIGNTEHLVKIVACCYTVDRQSRKERALNYSVLWVV